MRRELVFFTRQFPYGVSETFIENEIDCLARSFDKVYVVCTILCKTHEQAKRNLPENCVLIDCFTINQFNWNILPLLYSIPAFVFLDEKTKTIKKYEKITPKNRLYLGVVNCRTILRTEIIGRELIRHIKEDTDLVFYSYWFDDTAYVAIQINKKFFGSKARVISRAHRMDLYDFEGVFKPLRSLAIQKVERVYACSRDGQSFLKRKFPDYADKVGVSYLGTLDHGLNSENKSATFNIVSCSFIKPVKRVELILEALSLIKNKSMIIQWIHYGDGSGKSSQLTESARQMLPPNISATFYGEIKNCDLMDAYRDNHYDLFINVSESEGLPVSIMEAISFGIPVIATDVGGTREIVNEHSGYLIDRNFDIHELSALIERLAASPETMKRLRASSRQYWREHFDAQRNYEEMVDVLRGNYD